MIAWLLSPIGRKVALYAGIAVALFFAYRWWSNRLVEQGLQEGRLIQIKEDEKRLNETQEAARAEIQGLQEALSISQSQNATERAALRQVRTEMGKGLDAAITKIEAGRQVCDADVERIPGDQLDDAIRVQLRRLAAAAPAPQ